MQLVCSRRIINSSHFKKSTKKDTKEEKYKKAKRQKGKKKPMLPFNKKVIG